MKQLILIALGVLLTFAFSGCVVLRESAKYNFNDGLYRTKRFAPAQVYILHIEEDTIAVFPVVMYGDSTAIQTKKRVNYTSLQRRVKDNKMTHTFYKPSFDIDIMTIPLKYRPAVDEIPNQLITTFNGALFGGYRIDEYRLSYKRTPLNNYKQTVRHRGYSCGLYAGVGSSLINQSVIKDQILNIEYEGVTLVTGVAANVAADRITFGVSLGVDHLLDRYHAEWIYEGQPCVGFTLGLDLY